MYLSRTNTRFLWYRFNGNFTSTKQGRCGDTGHTFVKRIEAAINSADTVSAQSHAQSHAQPHTQSHARARLPM